MAEDLRRDGMPEPLLRELTSARKGLSIERLLNAGWGDYAQALASEVRVKMSARAKENISKPEAAELDEKLESVLGICTGKALEGGDLSEGLFLAGWIRDGFFDFHIDEKKVAVETALDGFYVIRTSLDKERASAEDAVRHYKKLTLIEQAYRSLKTIDLRTRPIRHHTEDRVRAHIFLCMLAYYVEWYMREAWRSRLFCDEDQEAKKTRDAVAPAKRSEAALNKVHARVLDDGTEVHSFQTLLKLLSAIVRNACRVPSAGHDAPTFEVVTTPNVKQQRAFDRKPSRNFNLMWEALGVERQSK